jgi:Zn-dependent M28 family amino/carboxypeptidase
MTLLRLCVPFLLIPTSFAQQLSQSDRAAADMAIRQIRPEGIRAHMRFLSDNMLTGRAPGTPGYDIAARYVASELEGIGLHPSGDERTWYQQVPLRKAVVNEPHSSVEFIRNGQVQQLTNATDYVLSGDVLRTEISVEASVVFVGFGVTAPDQQYDDYAGADVKGKVVAYVHGAPARFPSTERAYYSDGVVKTKNAISHGAIGILEFLSPEDQKRLPWDWLVPQIQAGNMQWLDNNGTPHNAFAEIRGGALLSQRGAEKLFTAAPHSLEQALATARLGQPQAFTLPVSIRIHRVSKPTDLLSSNIIAKLAGSDPALRDQYVVYTAHLDHLGICPPVNGDNVCHGTVDDASGTSSLLEIARAYASLPHAPRRSVLFVFVTGEEMGLLGSDYFAYFPTVPRKSIVANVNIDGAPGVYYAMKDIVPLGAEHSSIGNDVELAARQMGYEISPDPMPEEMGFIRSDQYSFVLQGIPAVNITDGVKASDPNVDALAVIKKWLTTRYHTPLDNMDQPLDYDSAARASGLNFLVGYELAQQDQPPAWNKGDFFGTTFGPKHNEPGPAGK